MAQQNLVIGTANAGGGDTPFAAFTKIQSNFTELYGAPVVQNISGAVSIDLSQGGVYILTLTGNVTSFTFTNEVVGRQYIFYFIEETTNKTFTWAAGKFRFPFGNAPVLTDPTTNGSAPARSVDVITALCGVAGRLDIVYTPDLINN